MTFNERLSGILKSPVVRVCLIVIGIILLIDILSYVISSIYLARYMESKMNRSLKGYSVQIAKAYFHPLTLSLDLKHVTLVQQASPKPPVASINRLHLSIHWGALIRARLVGDFLIDRPKLYINLNNIREEQKSEVPIQKKGWQEAIESIYPLKIDVFRVWKSLPNGRNRCYRTTLPSMNTSRPVMLPSPSWAMVCAATVNHSLR